MMETETISIVVQMTAHVQFVVMECAREAKNVMMVIASISMHVKTPAKLNRLTHAVMEHST
jgi:hypothetical protein